MTHYMHDEYGSSGSGSGFAMGLIAGAAIGAGVALLFAPREGSLMRQDLASGAQRLGQRFREDYGSVAEGVRDSARRAVDRASEAVDRGKDAYRDASTDVRSGINKAADDAREATPKTTAKGGSGTGDPVTRSHMG